MRRFSSSQTICGARSSRAHRRTIALLSSIIAAFLQASCLLTTSLDGLEGPPLAPDAANPEGGSLDGGATDRIAADGSDGAVREPIFVAASGPVVRGLAEHGADVYWVQGGAGAGIARAPKSGGEAVFVQMTADAFDVAADDNNVYWSTGAMNEVFRKASGSTTPGAFLFSGAGETLYLAIGASGLVYATGRDVVVAGPRGDAGTSLVHYPMQTGSAGIATSGSDIFWSGATGIMRGNESGQPEQLVYGIAPGAVAGIASDGQEIFWIAPDGTVRALAFDNPAPPPPREVCRASIAVSDGGARPDGSDVAAVLDVAVDDAWVYFAEPPRLRISKCAKR